MRHLRKWDTIDLQRSKNQYGKVNLSGVQTAHCRLSNVLLVLHNKNMRYFQVKFILVSTLLGLHRTST